MQEIPQELVPADRAFLSWLSEYLIDAVVFPASYILEVSKTKTPSWAASVANLSLASLSRSF